MLKPRKFAAVDTQVLLRLGAGDEVAQEAVDLLLKSGFFFIVPETVMHELADICQLDPDEDVRTHAHKTLSQITNFGFIPSSISPLEMGVSEQVAQRLKEKHLGNCELNDALCMTEAAYNNCRILITESEGLLDSDRIKVLVAIAEADLCPLVPLSPAEIVDLFKNPPKG